LTDRYGDVPAPTLRLMDVALVKQQAHRAWILAIEQKGTAISFIMNARAKVKVDEIDDFLKTFRGRMRIRPEVNPVFVYDPGEIPKKDLLPRVKDIIERISGLLER